MTTKLEGGGLGLSGRTTKKIVFAASLSINYKVVYYQGQNICNHSIFCNNLTRSGKQEMLKFNSEISSV